MMVLWRCLFVLAVEACLVFQTMLVASQVSSSHRWPVEGTAIFTALMISLMGIFGLYGQQPEKSFKTTFKKVFTVYSLSLVFVCIFSQFFLPLEEKLFIFVRYSLCSLIGLLLFRFIVFGPWIQKNRILVLGNEDAAQGIIRFLSDCTSHSGKQCVGYYPVETRKNEADRVCDHDQLLLTVKELRVSEIVLAVKEQRGGVLPLRQLLQCKLQGVKITDALSFWEREQGHLQLDHLKASWLILGNGFSGGHFSKMMKRLFDIVLGLSLLLFTSPALCLAMLALWATNRGPVFSRHERIGRGGKPFMLMRLNMLSRAVGKEIPPTETIHSSEVRITPIGRFLKRTGIDRLPQIINVLRGEMSFVGPRPERPFFAKCFRSGVPFYEIRHHVQPGITGWAQICCFRERSTKAQDLLKKIQYDLFYVKNRSFLMDLKILYISIQLSFLGQRKEAPNEG